MAEINLNTKILTDMEVLERLSARSGVSVYTVKSTKSEQLYVLKHISVPENQKQADALILAGAAADSEGAQAYYEQVVTDYSRELEQMDKLSVSTNLCSFRSYEIKPKEDGIGFDIYLLSEYRTTLDRYLLTHSMTHLGAVNLAVDLCNALCDLRGAGLIHRDVKPANIYMNDQGHFMLGDLGTAEIEGLKYCSMPERMISSYSAPELFELMASVNETIDLYSVGLILYRIYNGGHAPFEDERTSAKSADKLRVTGEELPAPMFADYEIAEIIRKACAFEPQDRYQSPEEMKQAFTAYMERNQVGDTPITPPIVTDDEPMDLNMAEEAVEPVQFTNTDELDDTFKESFSPDNDMLNALIETVHKEMDEDPVDDSDSQKLAGAAANARKRSAFTKWFPTVLLITLITALVAAAIWFFFIRKDTITIDHVEMTERTVDSITVKLTTDEDPESFQVICTDAYGNKSSQEFIPGHPNTFTGLASGAPYVISVEGRKEEHIAGAVPYNISTKATTQIISFTASRLTVSEIELTFIPDGAEPQQWTVSYAAAGEEPATKSFTGHTAVLTGLEADTEYEILLTDTSDVQLSGETSLTAATLPSVTLVPDGVLAEISNSKAVITWEYEGDAPASWNITTTGSKGYTDNQTVLENSLTLENLVAGETYSLVITCDNMVGSASTSFTLESFSIAEITAVPNENGGLDVSWTCAANQEDAQWMVIYSPVGNDTISMAEQTQEQTVTLTSLIPGSTYRIEIQEATGEQVGGNNVAEVDIPAAESFSSYGFTTAYVGIYPRPAQDNWTANNLQGPRTSFTSGEKIAFACETSSALKDSDDKITTLLVVRASDGTVVDYYTGEETWNNMWTNDCYVGELLRTPQTADTYSLELYFNGFRVKTVSDVRFTVTQ